MFKKFSWGHGVILALGAFIVFILSMIFIFSNGMKNSELISEDYYQDELVYQQVIDAKNNAEKLSEKPIYKQTAEGITITFPQTSVIDDSKAKFELFRTDDSNLDVKKELSLNAQKEIFIPSKVITSGSYILKLKWQQNKTPYQLDYEVQWK